MLKELKEIMPTVLQVHVDRLKGAVSAVATAAKRPSPAAAAAAPVVAPPAPVTMPLPSHEVAATDEE